MSTLSKRLPTALVQALIILLGLSTFAFLLWAPNVEGVNANATSLFEIYFDDPFLAYVYIGSIPFFIALYQVLKLLALFGENKGFTSDSVSALRTIKYCGLALIAFVLGAEAFIVLLQSGSDDIAGGVAMGVFTLLISAVITITAVVYEKKIAKALPL